MNKKEKKNTTQHRVDNGFCFFDLLFQWQKDKIVFITEDSCPLTLPTAPNMKAANTPLMTLGHTPAPCSHHHPPHAGQPMEVPEELASGSGLPVTDKSHEIL